MWIYIDFWLVFLVFTLILLPQLAGVAGWRFRKYDCIQAGMAACIVFLCAYVPIMIWVFGGSSHRDFEEQRVEASASASATNSPSVDSAQHAGEMEAFSAEQDCGMGSGLAMMCAPVYAAIHFSIAALVRDACESFSQWRGRRASRVQM